MMAAVAQTAAIIASAMSQDIREILLDLPLVQTDDRPEGMIVLNAGEVPEDRRAEAARSSKPTAA